MQKLTGIYMNSLDIDCVDYKPGVFSYQDKDGQWQPMDITTLFSAPVYHDPIKLDESGDVVVLIKTTEGDLYLSFKGE
jgi:hypothetical protein